MRSFFLAAGEMNIVTVGKEPAGSPRLIMALNSAPSGVAMVPTSGFPDVVKLLQHVGQRLKDGLAACWASDDGSVGNPNSPTDDEEQWARLMTELLLVHRYGSPANRWYQALTDGAFFDMMQKETDGCYPITSACQQLCTAALIGRGFGRADFGEGMGASPHNEVKPVFAKGGKFFKARDAATNDPADAINSADDAVPKGAGPGSMCLFFDAAGVSKPTKKNPDFVQFGNNEGDHIGFVLRAHTATATDPWTRLQFFDTGALGTPGFNDGTVGSSLCDYKWARSIPGPKKPEGHNPTFQALLVPAPSPDLPKAMAHMRGLYPLGVARLVIRPRKPPPGEDLTISTALMRMHDPTDATMNFSLARLLWSLRDAPFCDQWETSWEVSIPRGKLLLAMRDSKRSDSLSAIVTGVLPAINRGDPLSDIKFLLPLRNLVVDAAGKVHVRDPAENQPPQKLAWGQSKRMSIAPGLIPVPEFWAQGVG